MKEITTKKLLDTIIEGIRNRKGQRIVTIDLRKIKEAPVEMMLICEGQSNTQVSAIADEIDDFVRTTTHVHPLSVSGQENAEWINSLPPETIEKTKKHMTLALDLPI